MIFYFVVAHSDLWLLNGHNNDQRLASTTAYMCLLTVQALTLYIESHTLTWINHVAILGSYGCYWLSMAALHIFGIGSWAIVAELW